MYMLEEDIEGRLSVSWRRIHHIFCLKSWHAPLLSWLPIWRDQHECLEPNWIMANAANHSSFNFFCSFHPQAKYTIAWDGFLASCRQSQLVTRRSSRRWLFFFPISRRLSVHLTSNSKWQWSWKNVTYRTNETFFFHLKWKSLNVAVSWCRLSLLVTGEIDIKRDVCTAKKKAVKMFHRLQQQQPCREKSSKFLELFKCNENLHFLTFHDSSRFTFPLDTCDPLTVSLTFVFFAERYIFNDESRDSNELELCVSRVCMCVPNWIHLNNFWQHFSYSTRTRLNSIRYSASFVMLRFLYWINESNMFLNSLLQLAVLIAMITLWFSWVEKFFHVNILFHYPAIRIQLRADVRHTYNMPTGREGARGLQFNQLFSPLLSNWISFVQLLASARPFSNNNKNDLHKRWW